MDNLNISMVRMLIFLFDICNFKTYNHVKCCEHGLELSPKRKQNEINIVAYFL